MHNIDIQDHISFCPLTSASHVRANPDSGDVTWQTREHSQVTLLIYLEVFVTLITMIMMKIMISAMIMIMMTMMRIMITMMICLTTTASPTLF